MPARTSLPSLEDALDAADIPYRAGASSLVYRTPEVRDLLMTARAVDDPSDALALISALRSPLFGCGDDLWTWRHAGGSFHLLAPPPEGVAGHHPVREGIAYLRRLHRQRLWHTPGQLLDRLVRDRDPLPVNLSFEVSRWPVTTNRDQSHRAQVPAIAAERSAHLEKLSPCRRIAQQPCGDPDRTRQAFVGYQAAWLEQAHWDGGLGDHCEPLPGQ